MTTADDLLRRAQQWLWDLDVDEELREEIRAYLDAPKDEPVAWLYRGESWFDGEDWNEQFQITTHEGLAKAKDRNCRPLFLHPPTKTAPREPMMGDEIVIAFNDWAQTFSFSKVKAFELGVRFAERHHGIGGGDET